MTMPSSPAAGRFARALSRRPVVRRIRRLAARPRTSDGMMLSLGAGVGFATGLLAVALIQVVALVQEAAFGSQPGPVRIVAVTTAGGLAVGLLVTYWLPEVRGGGITHVMETIAMHGGRMRPVVVPGKLLASGLSLGTGASGGREGPIVQIGGAVGSFLGRVFALTEEQKRVLIAAGAAAGIAASFNAPIGGMLFAIEVIVGGFRLRYLHVIVVSSVVGSVTAREIVGEALIYNPPPYRLEAPAELGLFALVGLAAVLVGLALARGEHLASDLAGRLPLWSPLRTALGGLVVGLLALGLPEVLGTGDDLPPVPGAVTEPIAAMLSGEFASQYGLEPGLLAAGLLALLLVAKLVATCASIGTGSAVGSFSPAIFLGAALGGSIGHAATVVFPGAGIRPGALALVGMAAVLGASARAPLTGILIAFELTGSYGLVLPLMLATGIATLVADRIDPGSVYTLTLRQRGIMYGEPEDIDVLQTVRVDEIMTRDPRRLSERDHLTEFDRALEATGQHGFPVVTGDGDAERLVGVVTVADVEHARSASAEGSRSQPAEGLTVGDVCTRDLVTVTPRDPAFLAVQRMATLDIGRLPVVSEEDHRRLVGWIRRADIVRAYQRALQRSLGVQQRAASSRLRELSGTHFVEATVTGAAPACGKLVRDVRWPPRTLLTSIGRKGQVVMPSGSTRLLAGDEVLALVATDHAPELRRLLEGEP